METNLQLKTKESNKFYFIGIVFFFFFIIDFFLLRIALRVEESPSTGLEKSFGIVRNGLHDLSPIEWLHSFGVTNIARARKKLINTKIIFFFN